jgi:hypothetical protein
MTGIFPFNGGTMKECFKCKELKDTTEFYPHPTMKDGFLGKCKECSKADVKARYAVTRDSRAQYERERFQRPERRMACYQYSSIRNNKYPEKYKARYAVSNAVRDGRLTKMPCEVCGASAQAHHDNYEEPLNVTWLCRQHHLETHGKRAYVNG